MKKRSFSCFFLVSCILFSSSLCKAGPFHPNPYQKTEKIKERLVTLRNWKLMEEFNLSGDKATRVFNILKKFDDRRENIILRRRKLYMTLKNKLQNPYATKKDLQNLINEITTLNIELSRLPREEVKALAPVFTVREQARYLLFSEKFAREARKLLAHPGPGTRGSNYMDKRRNRPRG